MNLNSNVPLCPIWIGRNAPLLKVESVPGKVSGARVLKGTRMPVSAIFENIEAGASIQALTIFKSGSTDLTACRLAGRNRSRVCRAKP